MASSSQASNGGNKSPDGGDLHRAADEFVLHALRSETRVIFKRASGVRLWDIDDKEYLDVLSGTQGTAMVGHANPFVVEAVQKQLEVLPNHFFSFDSVPLIEFCARIAEITPGALGKTHLTVGGGEAIEAAVKLAMRVTGKAEVASLHDAYHGLSLGTMGLAGNSALRAWTAGVNRWPSFYQIPSPNPYRPRLNPDPIENARAAVRAFQAGLDGGGSANLAAVVLEIVQGPGGHYPLPGEYVSEIARLCREVGALLIVDEIQTGLGRCGARWACDLHGIEPDILVVGKALGGGIPFGAIVVRPDLVDDELERLGWNVLTFMNQPLQAVAGSAVIELVEQQHLANRAAVLGTRAAVYFDELSEELEVIGDVRGPGLFIGIDLVADRESKAPATAAARQAVKWGIEHGLITGVGGAGRNVLKFKPPLTTTDAELDGMLELMGGALRAADEANRSEHAAVV